MVPHCILLPQVHALTVSCVKKWFFLPVWNLLSGSFLGEREGMRDGTLLIFNFWEYQSECSLLAHPLVTINNLIDTTKGMATLRNSKNLSCIWESRASGVAWQGARGAVRSSEKPAPKGLPLQQPPPKNLASWAVPPGAQWAENDQKHIWYVPP